MEGESSADKSERGVLLTAQATEQAKVSPMAKGGSITTEDIRVEGILKSEISDLALMGDDSGQEDNRFIVAVENKLIVSAHVMIPGIGQKTEPSRVITVHKDERRSCIIYRPLCMHTLRQLHLLPATHRTNTRSRRPNRGDSARGASGLSRVQRAPGA